MSKSSSPDHYKQVKAHFQTERTSGLRKPKSLFGIIRQRLSEIKVKFPEIEERWEKAFEDENELEEQKFLVTTIYKTLKRYVHVLNEVEGFSDFYMLLSEAISLFYGVLDPAMYFVTKRFFEKLFPDSSDITLMIKQNGKQLGCKVEINDGNEKRVFFVKSHSLGEIKSQSNSASQNVQGVWPYEILLYQVLHEVDSGCNVYFYGNDLSHVFIATEGAPDGFLELAKFYPKDNDNASRELRFTYFGEPLAEALESKQFMIIPEIIASDSRAKTIGVSLTKLSLLTRVCDVSDMITNSNNIGITRSGKVLAVDLTPLDGLPREFIASSYESYVKGKGIYDTLGRDPIRDFFCFTKQDSESRVGLTRQVMASLPNDFVQKALDQVTAKMKNVAYVSESDLKAFEKNLKHAAEVLQNSFTNLTKFLGEA